MVEPLAAPFNLPDGKVFEVTAADLPVVRARLRHAFKKAREKLATNIEPAAAASGSASATTSTTKAKELPPGYWQAQVCKYEAVTIHGVPRKFPEMTLLGAEATLAKLLNDSRNLCHNSATQALYSGTLAEHAQQREEARSRSQEQVTTLVVNSDLQLETEPETPWKPKSQVAILDCLEAIRVALIFIGHAPENEIDDSFAWWHRLVRTRPNKIDQLKVHWENTSWRIVLALRKKTPFKDIASEIMTDNQLLQEAMNTEVPTDRPPKTPRGFVTRSGQTSNVAAKVAEKACNSGPSSAGRNRNTRATGKAVGRAATSSCSIVRGNRTTARDAIMTTFATIVAPARG